MENLRDIKLESNYEELTIFYNKVNFLRHANKTEDIYDDIYIYIKCFFLLIRVKFPQDLFKSNIIKKSYSDNINNLIFLMLDELIILGYYLKLSTLCLVISDKLILSRECPINKNQAIGNQKFYIEKLMVNFSNKIKLESNSVHANLNEFTAMNPSILKTENGYIVNCRLVNYEITEDGLYWIKHPQRKIITENLIVSFDKKFNVTKLNLIIDKTEKIKLSNPNIEGYEDLIMFQYNSELYFSSTTLDTNQYGRPQITRCKLNENYQIVEKIPIDSPQNRPEKNWLPFVDNDEIKFIYQYHPYTIIRNVRSVSKEEFRKEYSFDFSRFKGSAAPIPFELNSQNGYLIVVHETFNLKATLRCYLHRFVYLNKSMEIEKMSHPWFFEKWGIEFCRSMCHSHENNKIILNIIYIENKFTLFIVLYLFA